MNNKILQESADDSILQEDLDRISESDIPLEELKGKTVLVTGATGLIGSLLVKALQCCNRRKETDIKILALVRNQEKAEKLFGDLLKREDLKLVIGEASGTCKGKTGQKHGLCFFNGNVWGIKFTG